MKVPSESPLAGILGMVDGCLLVVDVTDGADQVCAVQSAGHGAATPRDI
jgi:hypothetical protein